jgi:hypothetical protein
MYCVNERQRMQSRSPDESEPILLVCVCLDLHWHTKGLGSVYHGTRARFLYFQSLQLLLRLQIAALQKMWELPPEFEAICKDVWALHLSMLDTQVPAEPLSDSEDKVPAGACRLHY